MVLEKIFGKLKPQKNEELGSEDDVIEVDPSALGGEQKVNVRIETLKDFNDTDRKLLYKQVLWNSDRTRSDYPIYPDKSKEFEPDVNIVLCETNHHLFYDEYDGPKIAFNVWETDLYPNDFFNRLFYFDEVWVPTQWQFDCLVEQGYPKERISIVPEGVDVETFKPIQEIPKKDKFRFLYFGILS